MFEVTYGPPLPAPIESRFGGHFETREDAQARADELHEAGYETHIARFRLRRHVSRDAS